MQKHAIFSRKIYYTSTLQKARSDSLYLVVKPEIEIFFKICLQKLTGINAYFCKKTYDVVDHV